MAKLKLANCGAVHMAAKSMPKGTIKKPTNTLETKTASMSAIARLGFTQGYVSSIMPSEEVFEKVASKTHINKEFIKRAYLQKAALRPLGALMAGGGLALAIPLLNRLIHGYHRPSQTLSPFHEDLRNNAQYNQTLSRDLQGIRGAFAPAESPFGKTGSVKKADVGTGAMIGSTLGSVIPGAGTIAGGVIGAGLGAGAGWLYNKFKGGYQKPNQEPTQFHRNLRNMAMYNQQVSRDLQGIRGAFAPAPNPWGYGGQG